VTTYDKTRRKYNQENRAEGETLKSPRPCGDVDGAEAYNLRICMQHKPLSEHGRVGGNRVSCYCIPSVVIWTQFVCSWAFCLLFFYIAGI